MADSTRRFWQSLILAHRRELYRRSSTYCTVPSPAARQDRIGTSLLRSKTPYVTCYLSKIVLLRPCLECICAFPPTPRVSPHVQYVYEYVYASNFLTTLSDSGPLDTDTRFPSASSQEMHYKLLLYPSAFLTDITLGRFLDVMLSFHCATLAGVFTAPRPPNTLCSCLLTVDVLNALEAGPIAVELSLAVSRHSVIACGPSRGRYE